MKRRDCISFSLDSVGMAPYYLGDSMITRLSSSRESAAFCNLALEDEYMHVEGFQQKRRDGNYLRSGVVASSLWLPTMNSSLIRSGRGRILGF